MKPSFALSLSFDGIQLLHRAAGGWRIVGNVDPQTADLAAELTGLRDKAAALEPGDIRSKLLIPNDQIKYMTIESTGLSKEARTEAARAALQGATPYEVADLVFDTSADGTKTHIAAIARQTLTEAENFAVEHGFNPISCVAVPGEEGVLGEPYFGQTAAATEVLDAGQQVEPDGIAVVITGTVDQSKAPQVTAQYPDVAPAAEPDPAPAQSPEAKTEGDNAALKAAALGSFDAPEHTPIPDTGTNAPSVPIPDEDLPQQTTGLVGFASRRRGAAAVSAADPDGPNSPPVSAAEPVAAHTLATIADVPPIPAEAIPAKRSLLGRRKPAVAVADMPPKAAAAPTPGRTVIPANASEAERMTIFGARSDKRIGGKPKYLGLMLCAALLVFLVGVAAWASVFMDDGLNLSRLFGERSARVSASAPSATSDGQILPNAMPKPEVQETIRTAALEAGLSDEDSAVLDALRTPVVEPEAPLTPEEIEAKYAVTGIWPVAPVVPPAPASIIEIDDLYLSAMRPAGTQKDAVALGPLQKFARANPLADTPLPPLPGERFKLDNRGMVTPSPNGTLAPDGFTVFRGLPPVLPPETFLTRVQPAQPTPLPLAEAQSPQPSALAAFRPQSRPGNLAETIERDQLGGLTRSELADFRPNQRPASVQQRAETARIAAAQAAEAEKVTAAETSAAVAQALAAEQLEATDPAATATKQAVAASFRPDPRPRNFANIVKRAERSAPAPEETRVAAVAPRTVSPKIPSKSSVARQATVRNAINLKRVNLIGVYGKPSSRRALIRLSNGRYRKVEVGDRLDGGRVSAIGDSELRYTKGGRNVVLKMPRG